MEMNNFSGRILEFRADRNCSNSVFPEDADISEIVKFLNRKGFSRIEYDGLTTIDKVISDRCKENIDGDIYVVGYDSSMVPWICFCDKNRSFFCRDRSFTDLHLSRYRTYTRHMNTPQVFREYPDFRNFVTSYFGWKKNNSV